MEVSLGVKRVNVYHILVQGLNEWNFKGLIRIVQEGGHQDSIRVLSVLDSDLGEEFLGLAEKHFLKLNVVQVRLVGEFSDC